MGEINLGGVSDSELLGELSRRPDLMGGEAAEAAGLDMQYVNVADEALRTQVDHFLDPDTDLSLSGQMRIMREFWGRLGYSGMPEMHDLSKDQGDRLREIVQTFPDRRIIPAPFLDVVDRKSIAERVRGLAGNRFVADRDALSVPSRWPISSYGRLLMDPERAIEDPRNRHARRRSERKYYALGYKTPGNEQPVGRSRYLEGMAEAGQLVRTSLENWAFPVMDIRAEVQQDGDGTNGDLYGSVNLDPASTPEALIALQLLRQIVGEPASLLQKDIANEAVYEVSKRGRPEALARVAIVGWFPDTSTIWLDATAADKVDENTGIRPTASGLSELRFTSVR